MELTKKDKACFNIAKEVSRLSDFPRVQIGCCAVYQHKVISTGSNSKRTDPIQKQYNKYRMFEPTVSEKPHMCHAEVSCLKPLMNRTDIDFSRVHLYVWRKFGSDSIGLARPCAGCMELIKKLGIRNIHYTNYGGYSHEIITYMKD